MQFFYLRDWHDNFLHYDPSLKKIKTFTDVLENTDFFPVVINEEKIGILRNNEFNEFFYDEDKKTFDFKGNFFLKKSVNKCNIIDGSNDCLIKYGSNFLMATPQNEVLFGGKQARSWEIFNKIEKVESDWSRILNKNSKIILNHNNKNTVYKNIFMFWDAEEIPEIVKSVMNSLILNNPDYNFNCINFGNVSEYLDLDIKLLRSIRIEHAADIIRFALLYKYGGFWLDSSLIVTKSLDEIIGTINNIENYDLVAFYRDLWTNDFDNPHIEIWFLYSSQGNELLKNIYLTLINVAKLGVDEYIKILELDDNYNDYVQRIGNVKYFIANLVYQKVLRSNFINKLNFYLWRAEDTGIYFHIKYRVDKKMNLLYGVDRFSIKTVDTVFLKLTGPDRKFINRYKSLNFNNDKSIIGSFVKKYS